MITTTKLQWICCFVLCTLGLWSCHEPYLQKSKVVGAKVCKFKVGLNLSCNPKNAAEDFNRGNNYHKISIVEESRE